jgi:hypothetical protein
VLRAEIDSNATVTFDHQNGHTLLSIIAILGGGYLSKNLITTWPYLMVAGNGWQAWSGV